MNFPISDPDFERFIRITQVVSAEMFPPKSVQTIPTQKGELVFYTRRGNRLVVGEFHVMVDDVAQSNT